MRYWEENITGERVTLVAFYEDKFAGSLNLLSTSNYAPFAEQRVPEINDFNVMA
jgi:hypothetical protein